MNPVTPKLIANFLAIIDGQISYNEFQNRLADHESILDFFRIEKSGEGDWLDQILVKEQMPHREGVDFSGFRAKLEYYGEAKIREWQALGMEPIYLCEEDEKLPGRINLCDWFYEEAKEGKILRQKCGELVVDKEPWKIESGAYLIDTRLKPQYDGGKQMYKNDNLLGPIIERVRKEEKIAEYEYGSQDSRFGVSADEWEEQIKPVLAEFLGLEVRLERTIEMNIIPQLYPKMPRARDGETNTYVWLEEFFKDRYNRIYGGSSRWGGSSNVAYDYWSGNHWSDGSLLPLAVL